MSIQASHSESKGLINRVAYNHAKPFAFHGDDPGRFGRKFLLHPLSNLDDSRFVVSVELQAGRGEHLYLADVWG